MHSSSSQAQIARAKLLRLSHKCDDKRAGWGREPAPPADLTGRKLAVWKYNHSAKRYACKRRFDQSAKGKANYARYNRSDAGKARQWRYYHLSVGKLVRKLYDQLPKNRLRRQLHNQEYRRMNG